MGNQNILVAKNQIDNTNKLEADLGAPQWINCDLRHFDFTILSKINVVM